MKTLEIEKIIEEMYEVTSLKVNPDFLTKEQIDVPLLKQVDLLLNAVGEKGLKLTTKGNLPTKVVKELTLCCPTLSEQRYLDMIKRYLEEEQVAAMRVRVVCEVGKLLKVSKGKMHHGSLANAYMKASDAEKFIYLLWQFSIINLAYFDRMQETALINDVSFIMLQIVRDKPKMFREPKVYNAFLLDALPKLTNVIDEEIKPDSYFSEDPFDEFDVIVKQRIFKNFFVPLGLVKEKGIDYKEIYECSKTALLDALLIPANALDESIVLDKKSLHMFDQRIKKEKLDINLFHDFCYIYVQGARYPLKPISVIADDLIVAKKRIGSIAEKEKVFYLDLANATEQTLKYFTQLEVKGGGSRGDEMTHKFQSLIDGLYAILPKEKPFKTVEAMRSVTFFFMDMLANVYGIDLLSQDFYAECKEHFGDETIEDIGAVIFTMGELEKKGIKLKRANHKLETMVKEALMTFILGVMSIHTHEMEQ